MRQLRTLVVAFAASVVLSGAVGARAGPTGGPVTENVPPYLRVEESQIGTTGGMVTSTPVYATRLCPCSGCGHTVVAGGNVAYMSPTTFTRGSVSYVPADQAEWR